MISVLGSLDNSNSRTFMILQGEKKYSFKTGFASETTSVCISQSPISFSLSNAMFPYEVLLDTCNQKMAILSPLIVLVAWSAPPASLCIPSNGATFKIKILNLNSLLCSQVPNTPDLSISSHCNTLTLWKF